MVVRDAPVSGSALSRVAWRRGGRLARGRAARRIEQDALDRGRRDGRRGAGYGQMESGEAEE